MSNKKPFTCVKGENLANGGKLTARVRTNFERIANRVFGTEPELAITIWNGLCIRARKISHTLCAELALIGKPRLRKRELTRKNRPTDVHMHGFDFVHELIDVVVRNMKIIKLAHEHAVAPHVQQIHDCEKAFILRTRALGKFHCFRIGDFAGQKGTLHLGLHIRPFIKELLTNLKVHGQTSEKRKTSL